VLALSIIAVALVVYFDLASPFAFNDEWVYGWSVAHSRLPQVRLMPEQSATALVQVIWSALLSLGRSDLPVLRLTLLPFLALAAYSTYRCARLLGADEFWSRASGAAMLANPLVLTLGSSFMSDITYLALLLGAAWAGAAWVCQGRGRVALISLTFAAVLQRQQALAIPLAVTVGLVVGGRIKKREGRDVAALLALWTVDAISSVLPGLAGLTLPTQSFYVELAQKGTSPIHYIEPLLMVVPIIAFLLTPFAAGLILQSRRPPGSSRAAFVPPLLGGLGIAGMAYMLPHFMMPGNVWTARGFAPTLGGGKPIGMLLWLFLAWDLLVIGTVAASWLPNASRRFTGVGPGGIFLVALALSQLLPLFALPTTYYDRYFLPVAVPLLPIAAVVASRSARPGLAAAFAGAVMVFGVLTYAGFQQDYEAWQQARDAAARMAYAQAAPSDVSAGYEANGVYDDLPRINATGVLDRNRQDVVERKDAVIRLEWSRRSDPRPGVDYQSLLAPGRVVLVPRS
jgi:hypothetical protein